MDSNIRVSQPPTYIEVFYQDYKVSRFDRFKIWFWNLILPPHIRLKVRLFKDEPETTN